VYEKEVRRSRATLSPNSVRIKIAELKHNLKKQEKEKVDLEREVSMLNKKVMDVGKELEVKNNIIEDKSYLKKETAICKLKYIEDAKAEEYKKKMEELISASKQKEYKKEKLSETVIKTKAIVNNLKLTAQQYKIPEGSIDKTLKDQVETANKVLYLQRKKYKDNKEKYEKVIKELKKKLQMLRKVVSL